MERLARTAGHRKTAPVLSLVFLSLFFGGILLASPRLEGKTDSERKGSVLINEICSWNETVCRDANERFSDYIELYNASQEEISIEGWHLSDDENLTEKCRLEGNLLPGEHRIVWADGEGETSDAVAFKIRSKGETVFLTDDGGNLVDGVQVPDLEADTVYARVQDGEEIWERMEPSPGEDNGLYAILRRKTLEAPVFSMKSGFYDQPFLLELAAGNHETIYYTMDGSEPTEDSAVYEQEILIADASSRPNVYNSVRNVVEWWKSYKPSEKLVDKAVIIRAVAMDDQMNTSEVVTATYFVGQKKYEDVKVMSLVAEPEELFGENGIYVTGAEYDAWYLSDGPEEEAPLPNFRQKGREWEAEGNVQMFESGQEVMNQPFGMRIQGTSTRGDIKKRFKIYAREEYGGSAYFDYEIFGKRSHSLAIRAGFLDAFGADLVEDRAIAVQRTQKVIVFLNGEYWYETYLREKYDKYYLQETYGVDANNVVIIKDGNCVEGEEAYVEEYQKVLDRLREDDDPDPTESYELLNEMIDMQSYIDFLCANIYLCNMDVTQNANYMLWRTMKDDGTEYGDGKWRWMLYDVDCAEWLGPEDYGVDSLQKIIFFPQGRFENGRTPMKEHSFLKALRHDDRFRQQFVMSFLDMVNTNFAEDRVEKKLKEWGEDLTWNDGFFAERSEYIVPNIAEAFHLSGVLEEVRLEINDADAGYVKVNACVPDLSGGSWTGSYFIDYPVTFEAVAAKGYYFAGWEGDRTTDEKSIYADLKEGSVYLKAVFEKE
ncbi:MAG TPA: hypothetical protein DD414_10595 [Lachnospiraceae bacterium]|nr:hypothetical protein [Lachnospiraceae bacterium]